jgi:hypothetical protein
MPFRYVGMIFGFALTSADLQGRRLRALTVAVVVSLGLSIVLLPAIGVAAALVAGVAGWVTNCLLLSPDILAPSAESCGSRRRAGHGGRRHRVCLRDPVGRSCRAPPVSWSAAWSSGRSSPLVAGLHDRRSRRAAEGLTSQEPRWRGASLTRPPAHRCGG